MSSKPPKSSREDRLKEAQSKTSSALEQLFLLKKNKGGSKHRSISESLPSENPQIESVETLPLTPALGELAQRLENSSSLIVTEHPSVFVDEFTHEDNKVVPEQDNLSSVEEISSLDSMSLPVDFEEPQSDVIEIEYGTAQIEDLSLLDTGVFERQEEKEQEQELLGVLEQITFVLDQQDLKEDQVASDSQDLVQQNIEYSEADQGDDFEEMSLSDLDFDQVPLDIAPPSGEDEDEGIKDHISDEVLPIVLEEFEELVPEIEVLLNQLFSGDESVVPELHRKVHTFKGSFGMVGAERGKSLVHIMESWMEKAERQEVDSKEGHEQLALLFEKAKERVEALRRGDHLIVAVKDNQSVDTVSAHQQPVIAVQKRDIKIRSQDMDNFITEINESRLSNAALVNNSASNRQTLLELEDKSHNLAKMLREIEIHAESQIQSRRNEIEERGEEFDPLEMDRYTRFQELTRFINEIATDIGGIQRDLVRQSSEQDTTIAYQSRAIENVREGLQRARLVPAASIADRLHLLVKQTARKVKKQADVFMKGGNQPLDRSLLEKIIEPLEHILRNALTHGIETPEERKKAGKPAVGSIEITVSQETGRVRFNVQDDGQGLNPEIIKKKAVEKGLWSTQAPMTMQEAADMICSPGFSTASEVSDLAGRGVGMDVVRNRIMTMGGRFEIRSELGKGMELDISLPTSISSMSVVMVKSADETWCVPAEIVEHMDRLASDQWEAAQQTATLPVSLGSDLLQLRHRQLGQLMGLGVSSNDPGAMLILKAGDQRAAVLVDQLVGVAELPMRSLSRQWSTVPGVMGASVLPDGRASFLVDPLRADWSKRVEENVTVHQRSRPMVLVVDDSITVRKVTSRFLEKQGYEVVLAKDGQEAVERLFNISPDIVLLDVEMPRMDGFDCARHIRENPKFQNLPIVMITSRTAEKHRKRALSMGVNEYLGKPFKEEEVLEIIRRYVPHTVH